jgi:hypothetical protein
VAHAPERFTARYNFLHFFKAALRLGDDAHAADGQPLVEQGRAHHAGQAGRRPPAHPGHETASAHNATITSSRAKLTSWDSR